MSLPSPPAPNQADLEKAQPFQCAVCQRRFTRMENLKRHAKLHDKTTERPVFPCSECKSTFSRADLRRRHVTSKHGDESSRGKSTSPKDSSYKAVSIIPEQLPDALATALYQQERSIIDRFPFADLGGPASVQYQDTNPAPIDFRRQSLPSTSSSTTSLLQRLRLSQPPSSAIPISVEDDTLHPMSIGPAVQSFFAYAPHMFPFLHQPTFVSESCNPSLLFAIMCLGLHTAADSLTDHEKAMSCYRAGLSGLDGTLEKAGNLKPSEVLPIIQAHILLEIYAILALCGEHTSRGLNLHHQAIQIARKAGLMEPYPTQPSSTQDLDMLWRQFIKGESHKRTLYALYINDSTWYHFLSRPRSLSHLEIKHELPCRSSLWDAVSATDWAHRSLVASTDTACPRFLDTIRRAFSSNLDASLQVDSYGASLMTHFVLSSVREMTGWSTMTGRSCFERFESLHTSMVKLEPLVSVPNHAQKSPTTAAAEATWRMSMIELLLWSQSHTGGLVEDSIDGAMAAIAMLGSNPMLDINPEIIQSVEHHVNWFLLYLHRTGPDTRYETPFLSFYLFKAAVIAWQIVRSGGSGPLETVGVSDIDSLLGWIRAMFERRVRWGIGKIVSKTLAELQSQSE
ncbi:hypothetical protein L198_02774 [Cryptococcus wingfieldii CBS 7118]|uniref:C2H2-type domain-containing protein n=1 Tax=Cryptococcus wingfieldii CBS 7118 TaxID=1295528 RepID=A0A1E3JMK0_9TREE|nr:hypothetical protein L198_02774 [Cryptococcus wingfieldii CBS 7118]ODO02043.1 hypothetical protein L198_02774 [Cryptococcus wingfieldii CBS 7118]